MLHRSVILFLALFLPSLASAQFTDLGGIFGNFGGLGNLGNLGTFGLNKVSKKLAVPSDYDENQTYPLFVVLHGCLQSANDMAQISQFNELAEEKNAIVLYPEQSNIANAMRCWNWFDTAHQKRDAGEPKAIMDMVSEVRESYSIDTKNIYVVGFSAGGAMASILAHCYSDIFAGVVVHSGLTYKAATTSTQAFQVMKSGSATDVEEAAQLGYQCMGSQPQHPVSALLVHGESDNVVTFKYFDELWTQMQAFNDYLDDGQKNGSLTFKENNMSGETGAGYQYQIQSIASDNGLRISRLRVDQLAHAWSGGASGQYSDPSGPNVTQMIWDFFFQK